MLLERHIVENLMGCRMGHCYGHTFSDPVSRWAMQRAIAKIGGGPGTMVYGNTTAYGGNIPENYAALAASGIDIMAQKRLPTGHAVNPVPVTEAVRIPDVDEIIDANLFANRMIERSGQALDLYDEERADQVTGRLVEAARQFTDNVLKAFEERDIDTRNPLEMLLALKRLGARRLEILYGPGATEPGSPSGRKAVVETPVIAELNAQAGKILERTVSFADALRRSPPCICVATTDVHEYGKVLLEKVLGELDARLVDAGVSVDADVLCRQALETNADAIAISTYNGIALGFLTSLREEMSNQGLDIPVFIGGKLNQVPADSNSSLPVDVTAELAGLGAHPCSTIEDMIESLASALDLKAMATSNS